MDNHERIYTRSAEVANRARLRGHSTSGALLFAEEFTRRAIGGHPGTFGVEYISLPSGRELVYLNAGDTYNRTLCSVDDSEVFVSTWGDVFENDEIEHCEDTGTTCCGWCSHYTPMDCKNWHDVVCESCGHHVDGGEQ